MLLANSSFHPDGSLPLTDREIFVFGSNLAGRHGKGSALVARRSYGAIYGKGVGLFGRSYAIPTKGHQLEVLPLVQINKSVEVFKQFTLDNPDMRFFVVAVGCLNAGYRAYQIAPMFSGCGLNCTFPKSWYGYV